MLRVLFIDADDEFYIDSDGDLTVRNDDGDVIKLVQKPNLRDFAEFIMNEADTYEAKSDQKEKSNG